MAAFDQSFSTETAYCLEGKIVSRRPAGAEKKRRERGKSHRGVTKRTPGKLFAIQKELESINTSARANSFCASRCFHP
jgi:hypothetical protein